MLVQKEERGWGNGGRIREIVILASCMFHYKSLELKDRKRKKKMKEIKKGMGERQKKERKREKGFFSF